MNGGSGGTRRRPLVPILARHLGGEFLRTFGLTLGAFIAIYVIADFFDRFDGFLKYDASLGAILQVFLFKIPLIVTQVTPVAVLAAALVSLGLLARHNEFVALRACGVSVWQITVPLLAVAALVSVGTFAWNETIVPYSARRWHTIETTDIKKREAEGLFTGRQVWYHGRAGFYNVERVSRRQHALYGLTIYQLGTDFRPARIIEFDAATWTGDGWTLRGGRTRDVRHAAREDRPGTPDGFTLPETFEEFRTVAVEPEELSYALLRRQIKDIRRKGADTSEMLVDLHLKLALPAASLMMMLVAAPLAAAGTRLTSIATSVGIGLVLGFTYFVVIAFTRALGQSGALPPAVAAWSANALFALIGGYCALGSD